MKIFRIIILFLFFSNNAWSYGNLVSDPWVSKFEYTWVPKFEYAIDEAFSLKSKNADYYFFGIWGDPTRPIFGYLNNKSKDMIKNPVMTGKLMENLRWTEPVSERYIKKYVCNISAHFGYRTKYNNQNTKAVPTRSNCESFGEGSLPVPMKLGWVGSLGSYDLYFDSLDNIKAMFRVELINYENEGLLNDLCGQKHTPNYLQCANYEIGKMLEEIRGQDSTQVASTNNQTQDNTKTTTTSSKIDINSSLSYWQKIDKDKKLELIEIYFIRILSFKADTTEEKNTLIDMSNNIIKCVDSINSNIAIEKAIGQCL